MCVEFSCDIENNTSPKLIRLLARHQQGGFLAWVYAATDSWRGGVQSETEMAARQVATLNPGVTSLARKLAVRFSGQENIFSVGKIGSDVEDERDSRTQRLRLKRSSVHCFPDPPDPSSRWLQMLKCPRRNGDDNHVAYDNWL